jgi:transcriptional regulator with XRE-family HTH domain
MDDQGWRLRAARAERGLTEDALAREMRQWADLHGAPRPEISANTIAEWEAGSRPMDRGALRLLSLALETPNHGWTDVDVDVWSLFRPAHREPADGTRRRDFLGYAASLGAPAGLDPDRLDSVLEETVRVDQRVVEGVVFVARQFRKRWGAEPSHVVRRRVRAHLEAILMLLDRSMGGDMRRDLGAAAATTAVMAGLLSILVGRQDSASVYLEIALRNAREADDAESEAMALLFSSQLHSRICPPRPTGDPAMARALLEAADRRLGRTTAPVANAWVLLRTAEERAGGDERTAIQLADEADRLTAAAGPIPADGLCSRWSTDLNVAYRGNIYVLAGRPARGIPLLETALAALPKEMVATRPMATADLGGAYAQLGEIDHACVLLGEALAGAVAAGVADPMMRIRQVRAHRLAEHAEHAAVRALDEQLRAHAALS